MSQQSSAYQDMTKRSRRTAIAQVADHRLISKAMQLRKQHVGVLLKAVRNVCGLDMMNSVILVSVLVRICTLHAVNLTIMSQHTILNIGRVYWL